MAVFAGSLSADAGAPTLEDARAAAGALVVEGVSEVWVVRFGGAWRVACLQRCRFGGGVR